MKPTLTPQQLQKAREEARQRYQAIGVSILRDAGVERIEYFEKHGRGHAYPQSKRVKICKPTTRKRLFAAAHEAGHIYYQHNSSKRRYLEEYEATIFAIERLREHGISIPRRIVDRYKRYVVRLIDMGLRRGGSEETLDSRVLRWCGKYWEAYKDSGYSMNAVYRLKNS